jgi:hypothetical protein
MSPAEPIVDALYEMAKTFEGCVVWAIRAMLETDTKVKAPFKVVNATPEGSSLYCILPTGNPKFHAQLVVGVEDSDLAEIFSSEVSAKVRKDALGEMANVMSGLFVADDLFIEKFGHLKPSTPFFSEGAFTSRKDWGIEGIVVANSKDIRLHFSIRSLEDPASAAPGQPDAREEGTPG